MLKPILIAVLLAIAMPQAFARSVAQGVRVANQQARRVDGALRLTADIRLDSVRLSSSSQFFLTPVLEDGRGNSEVLPSVLVNGRAMQIAWERRSFSRRFRGSHEVAKAVRRLNGRAQTVEYSADTPVEKWMWSADTKVRWVTDTCDCGAPAGSRVTDDISLGLNPAAGMRPAYVTPEVTPLPVQVYEGEAHVDFEVNESVLLDTPFRTRAGRLIDNRPELRVIDDTISRALSDGNVEIAGIRICGYASPEGAYLANERLATDRSRALSEYIAARHNLPAGVSEYDAVAENWAGLRAIVEQSDEIDESTRRELLQLIDAPAYGPADYDEKERRLRTEPRFAKLYREKILPDWFPGLRTSKFRITTRLRPLSDEALAEVIQKSPEKMSLNQMFRVARLYPEGSEKFNEVIATALDNYPDDPTANLNMAAALLGEGRAEEAVPYLDKAGDTPEAMNARGVLAAWRGDIEEALRLFEAAAPLPEAAKNRSMLGE